MRSAITAAVLCVSCLMAGLSLAQTRSAESKSKSKSKSFKPGSAKQLDVRLEQLQSSILRDTADLARDFEEAGELEQAKRLLEVLLKLNPKLPGIKEHVEKLDEQLLSSNEFEVELDTSKGWSTAVATVIKDKPVRIQAQGQYQFTLTHLVGPDGFPTDEPSRDMSAGIPLGALMGIIVENGKPGKPFVIGAKKEWTPKESGPLLLRVNVPNDAKCGGRLKVTFSGFARGS